MSLKEIDINFTDIKIGHAQNFKAGTGLTVILNEKGMRAGLNIAGGGPASREVTLLDPLSECKEIQAVLLSGGSALGLGAADGVQKFLRERGSGFKTEYGVVPLVVQSDIFDLCVGSPDAFPTREEAYKACENALENYNKGILPLEGSVGAGTGATVGKLLGENFMMKSGLGIYAAQVGELKMGCVIAVNSLGNVLSYKDNKPLAGLLNKEKNKVISSVETLFSLSSDPKNFYDPTNTTIGCLITNMDTSKAELNKIAQMGQDGFARAISPVHTTADGDSLYIVSEPKVKADLNLAGTLAAEVTARAINRAVKMAEPMYGLKAYKDLVN